MPRRASSPNTTEIVKEEDLQFLSEIGRGSMGVVYLAKNTKTGNKYAIKSFYKNDLGEEGWQALKREAEIMQELNHKNILKLHLIFEDDDYVYFVLPYMQGGELFYRILDNGKHTEESSRGIIRQIVDGLSYLHNNDIVHGDLKPENLLCETTQLTENNDYGVITICDFGLAQHCRIGSLLSDYCGSEGYAAPEIDGKQIYNQKVDIWALGVISYILLTGVFPFAEKQLMEGIQKGHVTFPSSCNISTAARSFVKYLLTFDPTKRPNCEQVKNHIWLCKDLKPNLPPLNLSNLEQLILSRPKSPIPNRRKESPLHKNARRCLTRTM